MRFNELFGRLKTAVQVNSRHQGFKRIGVDGEPDAAACLFLGMGKKQVIGKADVVGRCFKGLATDKERSQFGELAFELARVFVVQVLPHHEAQKSVAQEFQALIG
jgi:hypothetical protein